MQSDRVENAQSPKLRSTGLPRHFVDRNEDELSNCDRDQEEEMFRDFHTSPFRRSFVDRGPRSAFFDDDTFFNEFSGRPSSFDDESFFGRFNSPLHRFPTETGEHMRFAHPENVQNIKVQRQETEPQEQQRMTQQQDRHPQGLHRSYTQPSHSPFFHNSQMPESSNASGQGQQSAGRGVRVVPVTVHREPSGMEKGQEEGRGDIRNRNPADKRMRYQGPSEENSAANDRLHQQQQRFREPPVITIDDYSNRRDQFASPRTGERSKSVQPHSPAISEKAIPMPPPPESTADRATQPAIPLPPPAIPMPAPPSATTTVTVTKDAHDQSHSGYSVDSETKQSPNSSKSGMGEWLDEKAKRFTPLANTGEQLVKILDETELRVEQFRELAWQLELQKESLLEILNNIMPSGMAIGLERNELDELNLVLDRVLNRCKAVNVAVNTPRDPHQHRALEEVDLLIEGVVAKINSNPQETKETLERFLHACNPDEPPGPIDQHFQIKVICCTADDQKKIRRRLMLIIAQIEESLR